MTCGAGSCRSASSHAARPENSSVLVEALARMSSRLCPSTSHSTRSSGCNTLHPAAGALCNLYTTTDAVLLVVPAAGTAAWQFFVPPDAALVGVVLRTQLLVAEFDSNAVLQALTSSNALLLSIGTF